MHICACYIFNCACGLNSNRCYQRDKSGIKILEYFIKNQSPENCNSVLQGYSVFLHSKCNLATIMKKSVASYTTCTFF